MSAVAGDAGKQTLISVCTDAVERLSYTSTARKLLQRINVKFK